MTDWLQYELVVRSAKV